MSWRRFRQCVTLIATYEFSEAVTTGVRLGLTLLECGSNCYGSAVIMDRVLQYVPKPVLSTCMHYDRSSTGM